MQNVGVVNDHIHGCFRASDVSDNKASFASHMTRKETIEFWTCERRGAVEIATFSNPPHNYIGKPQFDELAQLN